MHFALINWLTGLHANSLGLFLLLKTFPSIPLSLFFFSHFPFFLCSFCFDFSHFFSSLICRFSYSSSFPLNDLPSLFNNFLSLLHVFVILFPFSRNVRLCIIFSFIACNPKRLDSAATSNPSSNLILLCEFRYRVYQSSTH